MNLFALCSSAFLLLPYLITCSVIDEDESTSIAIPNYEDLPSVKALESIPRGILVDEPHLNSEYTRFLVWYMIPEEVRRELTYNYFIRGCGIDDNIVLCRPPLGTVSISSYRYYVTNPEEFVSRVATDHDWIDLAHKYLFDSRLHSETTHLNLLAEVIKNASPNTFEEILQKFPLALRLLRKIQARTSEDLIDFILNSRISSSDIIEIFRILERYTDLDMANIKHLKKVRSIAYERDDCELLMYTNAYPDVITPSSACQADLFDLLENDRIPRVWGLICDNPHKYAKSLIFTDTDEKNRFRKHRWFSEPVNQRNWTLDMYAVACQEYELAMKLPMKIIKKPNLTPSEITTAIRDITHMIPLIPDPVYRKRFIDKYNLTSMNPERHITEFTHKTASGATSKVRVIPYCEQQDLIECPVPPAKIPDTRAFVSKIIPTTY